MRSTLLSHVFKHVYPRKYRNIFSRRVAGRKTATTTITTAGIPDNLLVQRRILLFIFMFYFFTLTCFFHQFDSLGCGPQPTSLFTAFGRFEHPPADMGRWRVFHIEKNSKRTTKQQTIFYLMLIFSPLASRILTTYSLYLLPPRDAQMSDEVYICQTQLTKQRSIRSIGFMFKFSLKYIYIYDETETCIRAPSHSSLFLFRPSSSSFLAFSF
eukprot:gene11218-7790_t